MIDICVYYKIYIFILTTPTPYVLPLILWLKISDVIYVTVIVTGK